MTVPFYATRMGHAFYERDVPDLVQQLKRLNENLEALAHAIRDEADNDDEPEPDGERHDRDE